MANFKSFESAILNETRLNYMNGEKKEHKQKVADMEKSLEEQLDKTLILALDTTLFCMQLQPASSLVWNWLEIIKLFEFFLLTESSLLEPRFMPTNDSLFLNMSTKILSENQKLFRVIKKLFDFFVLENVTSARGEPERSFMRMTSQRLSISSSINLVQPMSWSWSSSSASPSDIIGCAGCYLIDFVLNKFNIINLNEYTLSSHQFTPYENLVIQFVNHIKLYLTAEYPLNMTSTSRVSTSSEIQMTRSVSRSSTLSYYMLFLGHMSALDKGDYLIDLFKVYDLLAKIIDIYHDLNLMKLFVTTFNFYTSPKSRFILEKCMCLSIASMDISFCTKDYIDNLNSFKFYALKIIFNLYRANNLKFETFFLDIIFKSIFKLIDNENSWERVLLDPQVNLCQNRIESLIEFSLNVVEFLLNQRPEFINLVLEFFYDDQLFVDMLEKLLSSSLIIRKSNILRTKLRLLVFKFKLSEFNLNKIERREEQAFIDEQLKNWYSMHKMNKLYFQLIERYLFDANSINLKYINELEERIEFKK